MKKDASEQVKTHTVAQVDAENAMSFIDGYAHGFNIFMGACEKSLRAFDTVIGFYMEDDLGRYDDRVKELHLAHNAIRFAMSQMSDDYDEAMNDIKNLYDLKDYIADIN